MAITARSKVPVRGREAERTDPYVPNGGMRLPPWVFDGEVLADRLSRLKFERASSARGGSFPSGSHRREPRYTRPGRRPRGGADHAQAGAAAWRLVAPHFLPKGGFRPRPLISAS